MAFDFGRKYIGTAISCKDIKIAYPHKTFEIDPQYNHKEYDFGLHTKFYDEIAHEFRKKKIKGMIIGYPMKNDSEVTPMWKFIDNFIEYMIDQKIIKKPVTFVNEYRTTKEAAIKILRQQQSTPDKFFIDSTNQSISEKGMIIGDYTKHELMYKKTIYDVLAAQWILEKFLKMYNERNDEINSNTDLELNQVQHSDDEQENSQSKTENKYM